jgi:hypothetical protein
MNQIEDRNTVQSAEQTAGANKSSKSQSLRLEKQTIRTLTGAELKLVGGGCPCCNNNHPSTAVF